MADGAAVATAETAIPVWRLLEMERPNRSARRVLTWIQRVTALALIGLAVWAFQQDATLAGGALYALVYAFFAAMIALRLFAAAATLAAPEAPAAPGPLPAALPVYTILCPLYREAAVVPALAQALARLDYPRECLDLKFVLEADDHETLAAIEALESLRPFEAVIVQSDGPRTKPKALNIALAVARGDFVTVYDAEDRPHPQQLKAAVAAFHAGDARLGCVQAPLTIDNGADSWFAAQCATEYAIQFREILPLLDALGLPMPLGGTSNHFRLEALRAVRGWDSYNVTEDADLGYRLARKGFRMGLIAPGTTEEAPIRFGAWLNQRTRWIKGHIQTWLVLMRDPGKTAREMGLASFASMQLVLAGGIAASLAHGPLALLVLYAALAPGRALEPQDFALALGGYCIALYGALVAAARSRAPSIFAAGLTMPLYWPLASLAALRAILELAWRPHYWAKTTHGLALRRPA